jgi:hypothetical protein
LTHREVSALKRVWELSHTEMLAQLRADIWNSWRPREDKQPWTSQDFGAAPVPEAARQSIEKEAEAQKHIVKLKLISRFGVPAEKSSLRNIQGVPLPQKVG